jgi:hypothetical protein
MKGLIISVMAGIAIITTAATYEGKVEPKGIDGPYPDTCTLESKKAYLIPSDPGTVIIANDTNGYAKYVLVCP